LLWRLGVDMRPGEARPALLLFLYFFLIIAFALTTKVVQKSEFIEQYESKGLPVAYLLVAVCSLPILIVYSQIAARVPRRHLIAGTSVLGVATCVVFWWLFDSPGPWVPVVFYVCISILFVLNVSQVWSSANEIFDPRQAKRLFGFIGAGGLLGGIAGGKLAAFVTDQWGTRACLLAGAAILVLAAALVYVLRRGQPGDKDRTAGAAGLARLEAAKGGLSAIRRSRYLQLIALLMLLTAAVAQVVDLQINSEIDNATSTKDERTKSLAQLYEWTSVFGLAFQLLLTARIHRYLGIDIAMRILPVSLGLGSAGLLLASARLTELVLPTAYSLKIVDKGLSNSVDQSTRELLFLPVPRDARLKAKAWIDVFVQRAGDGLGGLLLLPITLKAMSEIQASWISLGLVTVWLAVTVLVHRHYVRSFREGLAVGVDTATPIDLSDATSIELLYQALDSPDSRQVINSLELLEAHDKGYLVPRLMLNHADPRVRLRTLRLFARTGRVDAAPMVEGLFGDDSPEVRVEAIRTIAALRGEDAASTLMECLTDRDYRVRAAAISSVAERGGDTSERAMASLDELIVDEKPRVRAEAARILGGLGAPAAEARLLRLLYDSDPHVVSHACAGIGRMIERDGFDPSYGPILISLMRHRRVKHEARNALVACGEPIIPALSHFLADPHENLWVRRAIPKTLARIDSPEAARALSDRLGADDAFLRRKVIEALSYFGERHGPASLDREVLQAQITKEVAIYLRHHVDLVALGVGRNARFLGPTVVWEERGPTLLHELLADRMRNQLDNVFRLLAALHRARPIRAARVGLTSSSTAMRVHALEYLDNTLSRDVRNAVFIAVDDLPQPVRFKRARVRFGIELQSAEETLERLISRSPLVDTEAAWLSAAAVLAVWSTETTRLYPDLRRLAATSGDPLIRETARWVCARLEP
jgi:AAA family ATP:ADP antiporter